MSNVYDFSLNRITFITVASRRQTLLVVFAKPNITIPNTQYGLEMHCFLHNQTSDFHLMDDNKIGDHCGKEFSTVKHHYMNNIYIYAFGRRDLHCI